MTFCRFLPVETFSPSLSLVSLHTLSPASSLSLFLLITQPPSNPEGRQTVCTVEGVSRPALLGDTHAPFAACPPPPTSPTRWGGLSPPPTLQASMAEGSFPELATKNSWSREGEVREGWRLTASRCARARESRRSLLQWLEAESWPLCPRLQDCQGSWADPYLQPCNHVSRARKTSVLHLQGKPLWPSYYAFKNFFFN